MMRFIWVLTGFALLACGGTQKLAVKTIKEEAAPITGPKATAEEVEGRVPPLRALLPPTALVPDKFVPPEPPGDPEPNFE